MSIYLICIYVLIGILILLGSLFTFFSIKDVKKYKKQNEFTLKQKKASLYIKYDVKNKETIINNYAYVNLDVSKSIMEMSNQEEFIDNINKLLKDNDERFVSHKIIDDKVFNLNFSFKDCDGDIVVLKCDYDVERILDPVTLLSVDELKRIHLETKDKNAVVCYLNVKDFNSLNQRYGQESGDYILEVIKKRLSKVDKKKFYCGYLNSDQFILYYNKRLNKNKMMKFIKNINKKLSRSIDIGYMNVELVFGIGVCVGNYETFDEFMKGAYIASDYAKKRKQYSVVVYNDNMKLEENALLIGEESLETILEEKEINLNYNVVYNHKKNKFVGYISNMEFQSKLIDFEKLKTIAVQKDKIDQFMNVVIDGKLVNYLKKRPNKNSKLFINLKLEDLSSFLEVYLSNNSYGDCKIVICLDVRKGYEMINKFSNISSNISKIVEEGIEFALILNYNNMYDYDYILKNASYLVLDNTIIGNINNNSIVKNKIINAIELAKNYDLDLFAMDVKEYVQFETLIKYGVIYFSGSYFGKSAKKPNEIEQAKTRIFAKFLKDSKKNKNN